MVTVFAILLDTDLYYNYNFYALDSLFGLCKLLKCSLKICFTFQKLYCMYVTLFNIKIIELRVQTKFLNEDFIISSSSLFSTLSLNVSYLTNSYYSCTKICQNHPTEWNRCKSRHLNNLKTSQSH